VFSRSQGVGVFTFKSLKLRGLKPNLIEQVTKKRLVFPSHLQISFYGDHLEAWVSSFEHTLDYKSRLYEDHTWLENELPQLFTVTNSLDLIADKRIILLIWLTNEQSDQEVIGQVNIKMSEAIISQAGF
jgi:hypothetical protein